MNDEGKDQRPATSRIEHLLEAGAFKKRPSWWSGLAASVFQPCSNWRCPVSKAGCWSILTPTKKTTWSSMWACVATLENSRLRWPRNGSLTAIHRPMSPACRSTSPRVKAEQRSTKRSPHAIPVGHHRQPQLALVANRAACQHGIPMVVSTVFRTGFGGEAFLYHPATSGCYECLIEQSRTVSIERTVAESKRLQKPNKPFRTPATVASPTPSLVSRVWRATSLLWLLWLHASRSRRCLTPA